MQAADDLPICNVEHTNSALKRAANGHIFAVRRPGDMVQQAGQAKRRIMMNACGHIKCHQLVCTRVVGGWETGQCSDRFAIRSPTDVGTKRWLVKFRAWSLREWVGQG